MSLFFTQVMNGLREVHTNKLLHLDLKPANIYLRRDASPILLDFGAARQTLSTDTGKLWFTLRAKVGVPAQAPIVICSNNLLPADARTAVTP